MESVSVGLGYMERFPYLALVDQFSGFKTCWCLKDSSTKSVVTQLETFFSMTGFPVVLRSDGGPDFRQSLRRGYDGVGIIHKVSAAEHHESNGAAECGIRELKLLMKTTQAKKLALSKLMLQLNNLQRQNSSGTPAQMF